MRPSGRRLAAGQLAELERLSGGAVQVLVEPDDDNDPFRISLDTHGIPRGAGITVGAREQFEIFVPAAFPYRPPSVCVLHRRWRRSPHVQWQRHLCLYAAPSVEWDPAEGMRGFLERLLTWIERAAAGDLDPDGQPLHPPVAYPIWTAGSLIVHPDLSDRVPWTEHKPEPGDDRTPTGTAKLFAWCERAGDKVEVLEWLTSAEVRDRLRPDATAVVADREHDHGCFLVPALLLDGDLGWEYPRTAERLAAAIAPSGYTRDELLLDLVRTAALNQLLRGREASEAAGPDPVMLIIGTPSRRLAGTARRAHLVAWKLDDLGTRITTLLRDHAIFTTEALTPGIRDATHGWLAIAKVSWMQVHEARPEVTHRRDTGTPASWLQDKRILVLGCGALGAPIAEHSVRAGARHVTVVDNGVVNPGILARQPYTYPDIGTPKATALSARLNTLTRTPTVTARVTDAVGLVTAPDFDPTIFDLIIDATADAGVRVALERTRIPRHADWPPLATLVIGHRADRGVVCLSATGATGGGHDLLRRVAIRAHGAQRSTWGDIAEDLYPDPPRSSMFFPEPGCSAPTFVGSAAQVSTLAAGLLLATLEHLTGDTGQPMTAVAIRTGATAATTTPSGPLAASALSWSNDLVFADAETGFEIRISAEALAEMRAETRRAARTRGPRVETGGLLLGAVDDAAGVVHVDVAAGPPPDSLLSRVHFELGTGGTQELIDHHRQRTARRTGYIGAWHTHPYGPASPSTTDEASLSVLSTFPRSGPWALMVILGGPAPVWEAWRDETANPQTYARAVHRSSNPSPDAAEPGPRPGRPSGRYFPGGYARIPAPTPRGARRRRWWPRPASRR